MVVFEECHGGGDIKLEFKIFGIFYFWHYTSSTLPRYASKRIVMKGLPDTPPSHQSASLQNFKDSYVQVIKEEMGAVLPTKQ